MNMNLVTPIKTAGIILLFLGATIHNNLLARYIADSSHQIIDISVDSSAMPPLPVRSIAEFEPMEGLLIVYPLGIPDSLVKEVAKDAVVFCITNDTLEVISEFTLHDVNMKNVKFICATPDPGSTYTRDFGPIWVADGAGKMGVVDPAYDVGGRWDSDCMPIIAGKQLGVSIYEMNLLFAGGNFMTDGLGAAISTQLILDDNFQTKEDTIRSFFRNYLGISDLRVVQHPFGTWEPVAHVDCFTKFLSPDKILIVQLPQSHTDYAAVEEIAAYFKTLTSTYGRPYKIYRVSSSGTGAEAYTNSTILNKKVLVPLAGTSNDDAALDIYKKAMPGYKVIGFSNPVASTDSTNLVWSSGDALHCRTMGIADRGMLYIGHTPPSDTVINNDTGVSITATIIPYSQNDLVEDSTQVYYKVNNQEKFVSIPMKHISGFLYAATIPTTGDTPIISYYIHVQDKSGRSENHPYIGQADPHVITMIPGNNGVVRNQQKNIAGISYRAYPNPFKRLLTINFAFPSGIKSSIIKIISPNGKLVRQWNIKKTSGMIQWNGTDESGRKMAHGIYYLFFETIRLDFQQPVYLMQ